MQLKVNLLASKVKWSRSIIACSLDAAFVCFNQIGNKVYISTPASKDMNTAMNVYITNNIISKARLATISDSSCTQDS